MVGEYNRTGLARPLMRPGWSEMSPEESRAAFWEDAQEYSAHTADLMTRYNVECAAEAAFLREEFIRLGIADQSSASRFEHPVNPLGVERIAEYLATWAKKL